MKIYTRTGDDGTTSLFRGKRVLKCEELVDVYGSIDEVNSWLGLVISKVKKDHQGISLPALHKWLGQNDNLDIFIDIQKDLFAIGSVLAGWNGDISELSIKVDRMEKQIDQMDKELIKIKNFIIPGGSELGSMIHITRAITRRVERQYVKLINSKFEIRNSKQILNSNIQNPKKENHEPRTKNQELIIKYLNRLSDLLFVLARYINKQEHQAEIVWKNS